MPSSTFSGWILLLVFQDTVRSAPLLDLSNDDENNDDMFINFPGDKTTPSSPAERFLNEFIRHSGKKKQSRRPNYRLAMKFLLHSADGGAPVDRLWSSKIRQLVLRPAKKTAEKAHGATILKTPTEVDWMRSKEDRFGKVRMNLDVLGRRRKKLKGAQNASLRNAYHSFFLNDGTRNQILNGVRVLRPNNSTVPSCEFVDERLNADFPFPHFSRSLLWEGVLCGLVMLVLPVALGFLVLSLIFCLRLKRKDRNAYLDINAHYFDRDQRKPIYTCLSDLHSAKPNSKYVVKLDESSSDEESIFDISEVQSGNVSKFSPAAPPVMTTIALTPTKERI